MNFFDYTSLQDEVVHGLTLLERLIPLIILVIVIFLIKKYRLQLREFRYEKALRFTIGTLMIIGELSYLLWNYMHSLDGAVRFITILPLHLCSYAIWGMFIVMFTLNKKLYNYVFMFGIIGALALFFPNLNHGADTFRYYQLYTSHSLLYIALFYLYFVHDFYPRKEDTIKAFILLQILIVFSLVLNVLIDAEYLFIGPGNKPIDFAWDWPWHMIQYEVVMIILFTLIQLAINKHRQIPNKKLQTS